MTLPGVAGSVPPARRFVERTLAEWEVEHASWTAALLVSELAANAALHAGTDFTVVVERRGDRLRLEVRDGAARLPRVRHHSDEATTGRGLRLVQDLALAWGVQPLPSGKAVWVELSTVADSLDDGADADVEALLAAFGDDPAGPGLPGGGTAPVGLAA